jgi:hypothetical protein
MANLTPVRKYKDYQIGVDEQGNFHVVVGESNFHDTTLNGLIEKIERATKIKAAKVEVKFHRLKADRYDRESTKVISGVITGVHASNNNLLVKLEGGKTEQESRYGHGNDEAFLRLKESEIAELESLQKAKLVAEYAVNTFLKAHAFDPRAEVNKALKAKGVE